MTIGPQQYLQAWAEFQHRRDLGALGYARTTTISRIVEEGITGASIRGAFNADLPHGVKELPRAVLVVESALRSFTKPDYFRALLLAEFNLLDAMKGCRTRIERAERLGVSVTTYTNALRRIRRAITAQRRADGDFQREFFRTSSLGV
jgi:hypothetical protein